MLKRWLKRRKLQKELKRVRAEQQKIISKMRRLYEAYRDEFCILPDDMKEEYDEMATRVLDLGLKKNELEDEIRSI